MLFQIQCNICRLRIEAGLAKEWLYFVRQS